MASIEKYPCFCGAGLVRFTSKTDRGFVKCSTETCTLFSPEEKYNELIKAYETKVEEKFKPNKFPLCECDESASLWVSHSTSNPDRPYFRCQDTDVDDKCDFFQWADKIKKNKKKKNLKRVQKPSTNVQKPRKMKKVKPLQSSEDGE